MDPGPEGLWRGSVARMAWVVTRKDGPPCELRAFLEPRNRYFGSKFSSFRDQSGSMPFDPAFPKSPARSFKRLSE